MSTDTKIHDLILYAPCDPHEHYKPTFPHDWMNVVWINYLTTKAWLWLYQSAIGKEMWVMDIPMADERKRCALLRSIEGYER